MIVTHLRTRTERSACGDDGHHSIALQWLTVLRNIGHMSHRYKLLHAYVDDTNKVDCSRCHGTLLYRWARRIISV